MRPRIFMAAIALCLVSLSGFARPLCRIDGSWDWAGQRQVKLYAVTEGRLELIDLLPLDAENRFSFTFDACDPGLYVIGNDHPRGTPYKLYFWFRPGDRVGVDVKNGEYTLSGVNTAQNQALAAWNAYFYPLRAAIDGGGKATFDEFLTLWIEKRPGVAAVAGKPTKDKEFDALFPRLKEWDMLLYGMNYNPPRDADPKGRHYTELYSKIDVTAMTTDAALYGYPFGMIFLRRLPAVWPRINGGERAANFFAQVRNDTLRGELVLGDAGARKSLSGFDLFMKDFGKYIVTGSQRVRADQLRRTMPPDVSEQTRSFNFSFPDVNGKMVSLSDFKGKFVVVDCWATWCMPCLAEIPALKETEKEFHGKDVVFVGISIDKQSDYEKWKTMLTQKGLTNVQLFASGMDNEFAKFFKITTIPRFMVFDREGRAIMEQAPRPSSGELKLVLANLLAR